MRRREPTRRWEATSQDPDPSRGMRTIGQVVVKVPKKVFLVDEIPMGPTGKLHRIGLAEQLGLS